MTGLDRLGRPLNREYVRIPMRDRFLAKVAQGAPDECWLWRGAPGWFGYGHITGFVDGKRVNRLAHRVSYEFFVGPIPDGLVLDHLCSTPLCVNPAHLEPVTQRENTRRTVERGLHRNTRKTHCDRGHEFTPENTRLRAGGQRECRTCAHDLAVANRAQHAAYMREWNRRRREASSTA
jgi:hypothetical protein